jgi:uncharacterized protein YndB with AHSA1/START domain
MRQFEVEQQINAPPQRVWAILTDAGTLASGPFGIIRLDGVIAKGGKLRLRSAASPDRTFRLTVTELEPNRAMVWTGGMPFGLFTGTRTFTLAPIAGGTHFLMHEVYDGSMRGSSGNRCPTLTPRFDSSPRRSHRLRRHSNVPYRHLRQRNQRGPLDPQDAIADL